MFLKIVYRAQLLYNLYITIFCPTGAVIAREYGLPCIVGAEGATEMFRTGDMVRLSGDKGFIEKVQLDKQDDET